MCQMRQDGWFSKFGHILVLVLVITGKGTACIPDQHKINAIIKLAIQK